MKVDTHKNSLAFDLAEQIRNSSSEEVAMQKAIPYYEMACKENDARAYLALYKIKITKSSIQSELEIEDVDNILNYFEGDEGIPREVNHYTDNFYLLKALELGYLPAFLFAGSLEKIYDVYSRLTFLSIGLSISYREKNNLFPDFQKYFLNLSDNFAQEFMTEIIQFGQKWNHGDSLQISKSRLHGKLIPNPNAYNSLFDIVRPNWQIFPMQTDLRQYLRQLPGADEYFFSAAIEDEDSELFLEKMLSAANMGNGQAIYALSQEGLINTPRCKAAEYGSPDVFEDLIDSISEITIDRDLFEISKLNSHDEKILAQIDCLVYLFTIMERLGISDWQHGFIKATRLSCESDSGYIADLASVKEIKYQFCDHDQIIVINNRAYEWSLGKKFDDQFFELLKKLGLNW